MKVSPFDMDAGPAERPVQPSNDPSPRPAVTVARRDDEDEQRRGETIEEPGYGHGVCRSGILSRQRAY
jgi:hypothetical protein